MCCDSHKEKHFENEFNYLQLVRQNVYVNVSHEMSTSWNLNDFQDRAINQIYESGISAKWNVLMETTQWIANNVWIQLNISLLHVE